VFTDADPQSYYPDALPSYVEMMKKEGWDEGQDQEELFELAMHESQYRDYKSGVAKRRFEEDLEKARQAVGAKGLSDEELANRRRSGADPIVACESGRILWEIKGAEEAVRGIEPYIGQSFKDGDQFCAIETSNGRLVSVPADMGGRIVEICAKQGSTVRRGDVIAYIRR
jgi:pyruvate carboxylase subunit B